MNSRKCLLLGILAAFAQQTNGQPIVGSDFAFTPLVFSDSGLSAVSTLRPPLPRRRIILRSSTSSDFDDFSIIGPDLYDPVNAVLARSWVTELGAGRFSLVAELFAFPVISEDDGVLISLERGGDLLQRGIIDSRNGRPVNGSGGFSIGFEFGSGGDPLAGAIQLATPTFIEELEVIAADAEDNVVGSGVIPGTDVPDVLLNSDGSWNGALQATASEFMDLEVNRLSFTLTLFAPAAVPEPSAGAMLSVVVATIASARLRPR